MKKFKAIFTNGNHHYEYTKEVTIFAENEEQAADVANQKDMGQLYLKSIKEEGK